MIGDWKSLIRNTSFRRVLTTIAASLYGFRFCRVLSLKIPFFPDFPFFLEGALLCLDKNSWKHGDVLAWPGIPLSPKHQRKMARTPLPLPLRDYFGLPWKNSSLMSKRELFKVQQFFGLARYSSLTQVSKKEEWGPLLSFFKVILLGPGRVRLGTPSFFRVDGRAFSSTCYKDHSGRLSKIEQKFYLHP